MTNTTRRAKWRSRRFIGFIAVVVLLGVSPTTAVAQDTREIRVMSFNIRYGTAPDGENAWPLRRELVSSTIRSASPLIVGLQEALNFQIEELLGALPTYDRIGVGRDDGQKAGEFSAILVDRTRFEIVESGTFWFSDTPSEPGSLHWGNRIPRICSWAHLHDRATGDPLYVYNVHWDHESQPSRERSARLLIERIAARASDDPVIVTGDFNAGENNPAFRYLLNHGLSDTFRIRHPDASSVGTFNGFRGETDGEKIDAVLTSAEWIVTDAAILRGNEAGRYPSDHFPVAAAIRRRS